MRPLMGSLKKLIQLQRQRHGQRQNTKQKQKQEKIDLASTKWELEFVV